MWCIVYTVCIAGSIEENAVRVPCDHFRVLRSIAVMYNKTTSWCVTSIKSLLQIKFIEFSLITVYINLYGDLYWSLIGYQF